jgi:hypothetical protein
MVRVAAPSFLQERNHASQFNHLSQFHARWSREEWPLVGRVILTIACIHLVRLLVIGAVVRQSGGKLKPSSALVQSSALRG